MPDLDESLSKKWAHKKVKVCPKGHKNSPNAVKCFKCSSTDLKVKE